MRKRIECQALHCVLINLTSLLLARPNTSCTVRCHHTCVIVSWTKLIMLIQSQNLLLMLTLILTSLHQQDLLFAGLQPLLFIFIWNLKAYILICACMWDRFLFFFCICGQQLLYSNDSVLLCAFMTTSIILPYFTIFRSRSPVSAVGQVQCCSVNLQHILFVYSIRHGYVCVQ